jgi:hypothetical protein
LDSSSALLSVDFRFFAFQFSIWQSIPEAFALHNSLFWLDNGQNLSLNFKDEITLGNLAISGALLSTLGI